MGNSSIRLRDQELIRVSSLLIGSIGTVVETSQLQLEAFNRAFKSFDLGWHWSREEYEGLLIKAGGEIRIRDYGKVMNATLSDEDISAVYQLKGGFFSELLEQSELIPRKGLVPLIEACSHFGIFLGWITTTTAENITAIRKALSGQVDFGLFDTILDREDCSKSKPDPEIYLEAIRRHNLEPAKIAAIEDSFSGVSSAKTAGVYCIGTPGDYKKKQEFGAADICLEDLGDIEIAS